MQDKIVPIPVYAKVEAWASWYDILIKMKTMQKAKHRINEDTDSALSVSSYIRCVVFLRSFHLFKLFFYVHAICAMLSWACRPTSSLHLSLFTTDRSVRRKNCT